MKKEKKYSDNKNVDRELFEKLSGNLDVGWDEPKELIWQQLAAKMEKPVEQPKVILLHRPVFRYAIAAIVVLMLGIGSVMRFYRADYVTGAGEHLLVTLPDGSTVQLNAESSVAFHPYWWRFSRELAFDGEGYFEVEKGRKFSVVSTEGTTSVLGTSFNIYARDDNYRVSCVTGKVRVTDSTGRDEVVLTPDQAAEWEPGGFVKREVNGADATAWIENRFLYDGVPFDEVLDEIERQYGIEIQRDLPADLEYTGNFTISNLPAEEVMNYVCKPFNLKFVKEGAGKYQVFKQE